MKKILLSLFALTLSLGVFAQPKSTINLTMATMQMSQDCYFECEWDFELWNADSSWHFSFAIMGEDFEYGHNYTTNDFDLDWGSGAHQYDGETHLAYVGFTAVNQFVVTQDASGRKSLNATVVGNDNNTYVLTYVESSTIPTVELVITDASFVDQRTAATDSTPAIDFFYFQGYDSEGNGARIGIHSNTLFGTFNETHGVSSESMVFIYSDAEQYHYALTGSATVTETATGATVDATLLCDNNIRYHVTMTYTGSLAVELATAVAVKLYPNPTQGMVNVQAEGVRTVEILDMAGRTVMVRNQGGLIDLSRLGRGVYTVRITTSEGVGMKQVVKN